MLYAGQHKEAIAPITDLIAFLDTTTIYKVEGIGINQDMLNEEKSMHQYDLACCYALLGQKKLALDQQIELLELKKEHLETLLKKANEMRQKGGNVVDFSAFDKSKLEDYAARAKAEWGQTEAYKEYEKKGSKDRMILFIILAVLFQPFFKLSLGRLIWNIVDVAVAVLLIVLLINTIKGRK